MEAWTEAELAAVQRRDRRRIWCVEMALPSGQERAAQTVRPITDGAGRTWFGVGANGEVQGMGTALGRRPREVTVALHGLSKAQSLHARIVAAGVVGSAIGIYLAWVDGDERLIVQPKLRFAGVVAANPRITLGLTDRVTLLCLPGTQRANRLAPPWDASPASHRAYTGTDDAIYDRVTRQTQQAQAI